MNFAPLGPIAGAYYLDNSEVAVIVGPVGSGKSTASALRCARHAYQQKPGPDGIARVRIGIVRNTKPQLKDTTLKTWLQAFPEDVYGKFAWTDMSHTWRFRPKGSEYPIEAEFIFRALDDPKDVANMLSLEVTGWWFNELREIDEDIIAHALERAGRFPSVAMGGCTWSGWIGDTNAWDTDHYLYERMVNRVFANGQPCTWQLFLQPSGMSPEAENVENLKPGYYETLLTQHSKEDADVYVHARWGATRSGKPIYTEFNERTHVREFELSPNIAIRIGMDFGRTPAALIAQRDGLGRWRVRYELCAFGMGVEKFAPELQKLLMEKFPRGYAIQQFSGDPSGDALDAHDSTAFTILKAAGFDMATPTNTNEPSIRVGAVQTMFRQMIAGDPALLIHPDCKMLRRACIDGYHYRKLQVAGNRYADKPEKNDYSHVAEALQYLLVGAGEGKQLVRRAPTGKKPQRYALT